MLCNCSYLNLPLNPILQKLTHHSSHVSDSCAPSTSLSGFNFLRSPLNFQIFSLSLFHSTKSIWDIHGQTSMATTSSHQLLSKNFSVSLCFLVLPSPAVAELLLATTVSDLLPPVSIDGFVNTVSKSLLPNSPFLLLSLGKKKKKSLSFIFSVFWC